MHHMASDAAKTFTRIIVPLRAPRVNVCRTRSSSGTHSYDYAVTFNRAFFNAELDFEG